MVILWLLRKVGGWLFSSWFNTAIKNQQERAQQYQNQQQSNRSQKKDGDIYISKNKDAKNAKSDTIGGEYVDYEEIKD
jgi:Domain of unknown function (DUF4834)